MDTKLKKYTDCSEEELVAGAKEFAQMAHKGQKDKGGKSYFSSHITAVADGVDTPIEKAVAYLHDVIEDTECMAEDLRAMFPSEVVDAVEVLTRKDFEEYAEYVWRVHQNPIATKVKLSDLRNNMDLSRLAKEPTRKDLQREAKYLRAYKMLDGRHSHTAVNPYALRKHLVDTGWRKASRSREIYEAPESIGVSAMIYIPTDMTNDDFDSAMRKALNILSDCEKTSISKLVDVLLA